MLKWLGVAAALALVAALASWPLLNVVETGSTPEYPELQPRVYAVSPERVVEAVEASVAGLPRWTQQGSGSGPAGHSLQAVRATGLFGFLDDVSVRVSAAPEGTRVSVRSASRLGKWDFGRNARNIRELLRELDRRLGEPPAVDSAR